MPELTNTGIKIDITINMPGDTPPQETKGNLGHVGNFDSRLETWTSYKERLEAFFCRK